MGLRNQRTSVKNTFASLGGDVGTSPYQYKAWQSLILAVGHDAKLFYNHPHEQTIAIWGEFALIRFLSGKK